MTKSVAVRHAGRLARAAVRLAVGLCSGWLVQPAVAQGHGQHGGAASAERHDGHAAPKQPSAGPARVPSDSPHSGHSTAPTHQPPTDRSVTGEHSTHPGASSPGAARPATNSTIQDKPSTDTQGVQHGPGGTHGAPPAAGAGGAAATRVAPQQDMQMGPMQGGSPPPDARDPDAYADGLQRRSLGGMEMADHERFGRILFDKFEYANGKEGRGARLDGFAWYGGDYNKLFAKGDVEREGGRLESARTEVLWDRVFATFWSTQVGLRQDFGAAGRGRTWAAFGVQGLAPYWFDLEATFYVGEGGRTAFRTEANYELLLTQRLILRPTIEAAFYGQDDPSRGIGSGLSNLEWGVRLRYEIRRQFAPYIGVAWRQRYGRTADFARAAGERVREVQLVAGVRVWY